MIIDAPKTLEKAELQFKIASLTKTLTELENQARDFEKVIQGKDEKIEELKNLLNAKLPSQIDDLPRECISTLKILSKGLDPPIAQHIASKLEIPTQKVEYFLDILKNRNLVTQLFNYRIGMFYKLNENSRKFLVEKDLL